MEIKSRTTGAVTRSGWVVTEVASKGPDQGYQGVTTVGEALAFPDAYKVLSQSYDTQGEAEAFLDGLQANQTTKDLYPAEEDRILRAQGII